MRYVLLIKFTLILSLLCGCSTLQDSVAAGGASGAAVGAGTGALIGSAIAHGDVAASALLGGAIGVPAGMVTAAILYYNSEEYLENQREELIHENALELRRRQEAIDKARERVFGDVPRIDKPLENAETLYYGPTLGNPLR